MTDDHARGLPGDPGGATASTVWPVLHYGDTEAARHFLLDVLGFRAAVVDAVHARVVAAGGDVVVAPHTTEFAAGGPAYACTVRDPEDNLWTFGTYAGAS